MVEETVFVEDLVNDVKPEGKLGTNDEWQKLVKGKDELIGKLTEKNAKLQ